MVDYIADYLENIRDRRVYPDVKPGYLRSLVPESAPVEPEKWDTIMGDIEKVIMPGVSLLIRDSNTCSCSSVAHMYNIEGISLD